MNRFLGFGLALVGGALINAQVAVADGFVQTGDMPFARTEGTATLLQNGKVLMAGGHNPFGLTSAALYEPDTGEFTPSQSQLHTARTSHAAVLLNDGKVLIVGGGGVYSFQTPSPAEIYDPATDTFTETGTMLTESHAPGAALLPDGKVLIVGGMGCCLRIGNMNWLQALSRAELYDPQTGTFTAVADMTEPRADAAIVPLADGRVMVTGGRWYTAGESGNPEMHALDNADIYEYPNTNFSTSASMTTARAGHTAVRLQDDSVLVTYSAFDGLSWLPADAELFDPDTGVFTAITPLPAVDRLWVNSVLLDNGNVLIAGGTQLGEGEWPYHIGKPVASADLYVPSLQAFVPTQAPMTVSREHATHTKLADGRVLIAGGLSYDADSNSFNVLASAEIYDPDMLADSIFKDGFDLTPPALAITAQPAHP